MKTLREFLNKKVVMLDEASGRGVMTASGRDSEYQEKKYIDPHIGSQEYTHELAKPHKDVPAGAKLRIVGKERIEGKLHVHTINDATREPHTIPVSKIHKPGEAPKNKGLDYETKKIGRAHV